MYLQLLIQSLLKFSFQISDAGTTDKSSLVPTITVAVTVPVILVALVAVGVGLFLKR